MRGDVLRIANCSGFFGDRQSAAREILEASVVDVLSGDWLAELTMIILQRQRAKDPLRGFASTFVAQMEEVLGTCIDRGIKIVSNAGGVNPQGCAQAVRTVAHRLGLEVAIGTVSGDDLTGDLAAITLHGAAWNAETGMPLDLNDADVLAANAYLGGWGIESALSAGADIVITGRVTDAALVVGPAAWSFGWKTDDWDFLAGAVIAGHVIECGGQATGGNFSFFDEIPDMRRVGFPIAEIHHDGSSVITKAEGTGGSVTKETVTAQLLYEVTGPRYLNPDVTARLDSVRLTDAGRDRVRIEGVRGEAPPERLKVSIALRGGYRNTMSVAMTGELADRKAAAAAEAIWDLIPGGRSAFQRSNVEILGRPVENPADLGEAISILRITVADSDEALVGRVFSSAVIQTGLSSIPGFFTTTPPTAATPYARYLPALVAADQVLATVELDGVPLNYRSPTEFTVIESRNAPQDLVTSHSRDIPGPTQRVSLGTLFGARSGDKGGNANLGLWARSPEAYRWLADNFDADLLSDLLPDGQLFRIERFTFPEIAAINFVIHGWLGDGVASSLRFDSQAKGLAEYIRARHVEVPTALLDSSTGFS